MKKLLLLGGLRYLLPVIEEAHKLSLYVITCDNVPSNIAHKYADEYHNISILDKEAVLILSQKLSIDGIMSFAVDPGVLTAAYVAEQLNLPFAGSYDAVKILQNKDLFRQFLTDHNFTVPISGGYSNYEVLLSDIGRFTFPIIVKPVDSAGSKGVNRVDSLKELSEAFEVAQKLSFSGRVIVEEYIEQLGYSSDSDCFSYKGKLIYTTYSDQMFDTNASNPYTPAAYIWPNTMDAAHIEELNSELQRLFNLLKLQTSIYNIETRIGKDGRAYIMEVSPRGGGNRISEILNKATGINVIKLAILASIGEVITTFPPLVYNGVWAEVVVHSDKKGLFDSLSIDSTIKKYVVEEDMWVNEGDVVHEFTGANETIGTVVLRFKNTQELKIIWPMVKQSILVNVN